jgi:putative IMPACT (imprinted ancient) family translation regulator
LYYYFFNKMSIGQSRAIIRPLLIRRSTTAAAAAAAVVTESAIITEKKSRFKSFATRIHSPSDARAFQLSMRDKERHATHAMLAWKCNGTSGRDDDGESGAGERVHFLFERLAIDNVAVCTLRWHGGSMLGANRFKHISNAARDALIQLNKTS